MTSRPEPGTAIRHALLALLAEEPGHGYALKLRFERLVGDVWTLNIGQVYDALSRLERDGLVEATGEADGTRIRYRATPAGATRAAAWLESPPEGGAPPRDELAIRLLVAHALDADALAPVIQRHRELVIERIQHLGRERARATAADEHPRAAILDLLLLRADADSRWIDLLEQRLARPTTTPGDA
jgi:DNA-binding PadR family transcriptional regulator